MALRHNRLVSLLSFCGATNGPECRCGYRSGLAWPAYAAAANGVVRPVEAGKKEGREKSGVARR